MRRRRVLLIRPRRCWFPIYSSIHRSRSWLSTLCMRSHRELTLVEQCSRKPGARFYYDDWKNDKPWHSPGCLRVLIWRSQDCRDEWAAGPRSADANSTRDRASETAAELG